MKIFRHTFYNLIGLGLPLVVAVFTIPILINELGEARFGILTLIWAVVSYFGLFDLGLGRALTLQLARAIGTNRHSEVGEIVGTATILMSLLGTVAGLILAASAEWGIGIIKETPDKKEVLVSIYAMALAMPFIVLSNGFRGILEARQAFGVINVVRLPMGLFTFIGPLIIVNYYGPRLDYIAALLSLGRLIGCVVYGYLAWVVLDKKHQMLRFKVKQIKPLCIAGGWMTASNIISPFMGYIDRFMIGTVVSVAAVAHYVTPQELVIKLWIIPGAITAVLFPAFAAQVAQNNEVSWDLFRKSVFWILIALLPMTTGLAIFANEILSTWIDAEFAQHSSTLLQIFALGILINCLAHVPFTLLQGAGAAKQTALIHLIELPIFLTVLWWLTLSYGILGAAIAWLLRIILDTILMFAFSAQQLDKSASQMLQRTTWGLTGCVIISFSGVFISSLTLRIAWEAIIIIIVICITFVEFSKRGMLCSTPSEMIRTKTKK